MGEEYKPDSVEERKAEFERRKAELYASLRDGLVHDPFTAAVASIFTVKALLGIGVSVGLSIGVGALTRAITPRQKLERGRMTGEVFLQRAGQGEFWDEVYGADPETNATAWAASTPVTLNQRIKPPTRNGRYYRVTVAGTTGASPPTWPTVKGATVASGTATLIDMGETGGGVRKGPLLLWMPPEKPIRDHKRTGRGGQGGGKGGPKQPEVTEITYDTDLAHGWGRGSLLLKKLWAAADVLLDLTPARQRTMVFDPSTLTDGAYDHKLPPDPEVPYLIPGDRFDGDLLDDGLGGRTGTVSGGANANLAVYEGNATQLQDPTVEAATDAKHGAGSTPAYRNRCYSVLKSFYLTRYQGAIPPFTALVESKTVLTFKHLSEHLCGRVALLPTDYDFSGLTTIDVRGLLISSRYTPKGVLEQLAPLYNCYFFESDKIYGRLKGQASVVTIDDSEIGWLEEDSDSADVLPEVDYEYPVETDIPRRVELRFIDPARDFEPNMHGSARQVTTSERTEAVEVQVALTSEEAREVTDRLLYETEVESVPLRFTLPWTYLYLNAGDVITVTRDEGFTETLQLTSIKKCIGPLECEAVRVESAVFTQPAVAQGSAFEVPPAPVAGMTIVSFFDVPLLRDAESNVNGGSGFYAGATKRTGDGTFNGAGLYVDRGLDYELLGTFELPATMGRAVGVLTAATKTTEVVADAVTVDLYGAEAALESTDREKLMLGAGACIVGDEVCQILTATNVSDVNHPNRWNLIIGLRGRRGTEDKVGTHVAGERFALVNDALKFIPVNINEVNLPRTYKAVTSGQSLADAAEVDFTWTGGALKALAPTNATRIDDAEGSSLFRWAGRGRLGHGIRTTGYSAFEEWEREIYEVEIWNQARTQVLRVMPVVVGMALPALYRTSEGGVAGSKGTWLSDGSMSGHTLQVIPGPGNFFEARMEAGVSPNADYSRIGLVSVTKDFKNISKLNLTDTTEYDYLVHYSEDNPGTGVRGQLTVYERGVLKHAYFDCPVSPRVRILLSGNQVSFFANWRGPGSPPFYASGSAPSPPYHVGVYDSGIYASVNEAAMTVGPQPATVYSAAQQAADGLVLGANIEANIYQVFPGLGRGRPLRVTLINNL